LTDQTEVVLFERSPKGGLGYGWYAAEVSESDTITLDNFDKILAVVIRKLEDNSSVSSTLATNVITITESGLSSARVLVGAVGV